MLTTTLSLPPGASVPRAQQLVLTTTPPLPQEQAYRALSSLCQGPGPEGRARRVRAMDSGVLDAARSSMSIFGYEAPPHAEAVRALIVIISGVDSMGKARQHRAADH